MSNKLNDQVFDLLLKQALEQQIEDSEPELLTPEEGEPTQNFSPRFEKAMGKLIKQEQKQRWRPARNRVLRRVAASAALALLVLGFAVSNIDAVRIPVMNFWMDIKHEFSVIRFQDGGSKQIESRLFADKLPTYIPKGYAISDVQESEPICSVTYSNGEEWYAMDYFPTEAGTSAIDTENAEITNREINGNPAVIVQKNQTIQLITVNENGRYEFLGKLSLEEMLKIAESIPSDSTKK